MADPVWPVSLPVAGANGVSGGPQSNVISFEPDVGPTIDRRRASVVTRLYDVTLPMLTAAQYATFATFFNATLNGGILPFTWVNPMTSATQRVKFVQKDQGYQEERVTKDYYKISFRLAVLR